MYTKANHEEHAQTQPLGNASAIRTPAMPSPASFGAYGNSAALHMLHPSLAEPMSNHAPRRANVPIQLSVSYEAEPDASLSPSPPQERLLTAPLQLWKPKPAQKRLDNPYELNPANQGMTAHHIIPRELLATAIEFLNCVEIYDEATQSFMKATSLLKSYATPKTPPSRKTRAERSSTVGSGLSEEERREQEYLDWPQGNLFYGPSNRSEPASEKQKGMAFDTDFILLALQRGSEYLKERGKVLKSIYERLKAVIEALDALTNSVPQTNTALGTHAEIMLDDLAKRNPSLKDQYPPKGFKVQKKPLFYARDFRKISALKVELFVLLKQFYQYTADAPAVDYDVRDWKISGQKQQIAGRTVSREQSYIAALENLELLTQVQELTQTRALRVEVLLDGSEMELETIPEVDEFQLDSYLHGPVFARIVPYVSSAEETEKPTGSH